MSEAGPEEPHRRPEAANCGATNRDIINVAAWAAIIADVLVLAPPQQRGEILRRASEYEAGEVEKRRTGERFTLLSLDEMEGLRAGPVARNWNVIMRLKGLLIQVFARDITVDHSPPDASKILFARQQFGHGSGCLGDYIDDLPRQKQSAPAA